MKLVTMVTAAIAATAAVSAVVITAPAAGAATAPIWEPDPGSVGTIAFYDAAGEQVTSGTITAKPFAVYFVGSGVTRASDDSALVEVAQPNPNNNIGLWNADSLNGANNYPLTSGPANIQTLSATHPVSVGLSSDLALSDFIGEFPNSGPSGPGCAYSAAPSGCTNTAYQNVYQFRLITGTGSSQSTKYNVADVLVSGNTWTQVYPTVAAGTTTMLTATPSPATEGGAIALDATVSPSDAAGTVQFKDGTTDLGTPVAVTGGHASTTTSTLTAGSHDLSAVFTPTDPTSFNASTGTFTEVVNSSTATSTTTALVVSGGNTTPGSAATLTATVTPSAAVGPVAFYDNGSATPIAGTVTNPSPGQYVLEVPSGFTAGNHSIVAVFTPTDLAAFQASQSAPQVFTTQVVQATTTTALTVSPAGHQTGGSPSTLTAVVSPSSAAGKVQFKDGNANLGGQVTVSLGTAHLTTSTLAAGTHSLKAVFTPTDSAAFATSTSAAVAYSVKDRSSLTISRSTAVRSGSSTTTGTVLKDARTGRAVAHAAVKLFGRLSTARTWSLIGTSVTSTTGVATKAVRPSAKAYYMWQFAGSSTLNATNSGTQTVSVGQVVAAGARPTTVRHGKSIKIYGWVSPSSSGQKIVLQRLFGKAWKNFSTVTIRKQKLPNGQTRIGYVFGPKLSSKGTYRFRVYKPATSTLLAGYSSTVTVKAT
jgi:hypothetical protein